MSEQASQQNDMVPLAVIDHILKITSDSNKAYSALVSALDAMSSNLIEVSGKMEALQGTIQDEDLAKVIGECATIIKNNSETIHNTIGAWMDKPEYSLLSGVTQCLEYKRCSPEEVQDLSASVVTFLSVVSFIRAHAIKIVFAGGILFAYFAGAAGITLKDHIFRWFGF
jgi:hypothetical protein